MSIFLFAGRPRLFFGASISETTVAEVTFLREWRLLIAGREGGRGIDEAGVDGETFLVAGVWRVLALGAGRGGEEEGGKEGGGGAGTERLA